MKLREKKNNNFYVFFLSFNEINFKINNINLKVSTSQRKQNLQFYDVFSHKQHYQRSGRLFHCNS